MTPPALVLLSREPSALAPLVKPLSTTLGHVRPDLRVGFAHAEPQSLLAAVAHARSHGAAEVVFVPLVAAGTEVDDTLDDLVAITQLRSGETPVSLGDPLRATSGCFSALDRALHRALAASGAREIDALVLWHDADPSDTAALERRARIWAAHHRLPVQLAPLRLRGRIDDAVAAHRAAGHRHVGVATLAVHAPAEELARAARLPGVVAVSRPLAGDTAVAEAILASYAVAALRALDAPLAS